MKKNNKFLLAIFGFFLVGIVVAVWAISQQTHKASKAAPSTTLSFAPATQNGNVGDTFSSDIMVDPGNNFVSTLNINLSYDSSKISLSPSNITINSAAFSQILANPSQPQCNQSLCTISFSLGTGSDPTRVITSKTKAATVNIKAIAATNGTSTIVAFTNATTVYSSAPTDTQRENVLALVSPLTITVGNGGGSPTPPVCQVNTAACQWDQIANTTTYHVKVENITNGGVVIEQDVADPTTFLSFPSQPGITYKCTVTGANSCGQSQPGTGSATCPLPSPTPSSPPSPSPTSCPAPQGVTNLQIICPNCNNGTN